VTSIDSNRIELAVLARKRCRERLLRRLSSDRRVSLIRFQFWRLLLHTRHMLCRVANGCRLGSFLKNGYPGFCLRKSLARSAQSFLSSLLTC
jgi:hypothetical protein